MICDVFVLFCLSLGFLPKALAEVTYFHEIEEAKKTIKFWATSSLGVFAALCCELYIIFIKSIFSS